MKGLMAVIFCALTLLAGVQPSFAKEGSGTAYLPSYLVGIIAVACFLVIAFVFLLFNHFVCERFYEKDEDYPDEELIDEMHESPPNYFATVDEKESHSPSTSASSSSRVYVNSSFKPDQEEVTAL